MANRAIAAALCCCLASPALAQHPKATAKTKAPKIDLGIKEFGALPTNERIRKPSEAQPVPTKGGGASLESCYSLLGVVHGKKLTRGPEGAKAAEPFPSLTLVGDPPMSEKFVTVVRVRCNERKGGSVEVAILDPRGDTVMEARGQMTFRNVDEAEWQVEWEPTAMRFEGDYQVLVRVAGQPLGTTPLKVVREKDE